MNKGGIMNLLKKKQITSIFKVLFGVIILILLILGIRGFMGDFNLRLLEKSIHDMSDLSFVAIIILGLIAFAPMCLYDFLIKRKMNFNLSIIKILKYSWIVNAVTIVAGLGDAAGISLRTYFYKDENENKKLLLTEITKISLLNPSGLSILSVVYLIFYFRGNDLFSLGNICAILLTLYIPGILAYIVYKSKRENSVVEGKHIFGIVIASFLDWAFSIGLFYSIVVILGVKVSFAAFFPVFVIAMILGMVSMLPGAIGAFDLSMLIGLTSLGLPKELCLLSVFLYRLVYYIIPLAIAALLFLHELWFNRDKRVKNIISLVFSKLSFLGLKILVFLSGVSLLISTAVPNIVFKIKEIRFLSASTEMHFSKFLVIVVGFILIVLATLIKTRAKSIYYLTLIILLIGTIFTVLKSFNYIAAGYLLIVFIIILLSKKEFYRKSFIISSEDIVLNAGLLLLFWVIYLIGIYMNYPFKIYKLPFIFKRLNLMYRDLISYSTIGLIVGILFLVIMYVLGKNMNKIRHMRLDECEEEVKEFLSKYNGTSLTHLIYLNDKYIYLSKKYDGMIQYAVSSNKLFVLGNPLGDMNTIKEFIEEFYDFADMYGYIPIFFEVSASMFEILHEFGYEFMKLGEAAIVNLDDFTIAGQKMQKVRTCCNKINKLGYTFEVIEENISHEVLMEVKEVSDIWLNGRKEKGFSMGFFNEEYIKRGPIGLVRDNEGILKAFVTIMPTYGENKKLCSDLMRFSKNNPRGVMDYMFVKVMEWGKENGYKYFDFGSAPLSNVGTYKYSFLSEKIAFQLYMYGKGIYSFEGLRNFKGKYAHTWEPKFLAYKNRLSLPITTIQANLIVSNSEEVK